MTELVALAAGVVLGWLLGRRTGRAAPPAESGDRPRSKRRPSRKQQEILAMMPPAPAAKTLDDLVAEEVEETGVDRISGAAGIPVDVRLKVHHRDRPGLDCEDARLAFVMDEGILPGDATVETTRLVCE